VLLGLIVFGIAGMVWLLVVGGAAFLAEYQGAEYKCSVEGPYVVRAFPSEVGPVSGGFTLWPLGRECEWPTEREGETVVARGDYWAGTVALIALGVTSVAGLGLGIAAAVGRSPR